MSRRSRAELEAAGIEAIRGWQTDQDIFDEAAATYAGLNRTDFRCLDIIDREGPLTAGDLAAASRLTSGAITAVLDRLEGRGLVHRIRDAADRRRVLVQAAPNLMEQGAAIFGPIAEEGIRHIRTYTDEELELIVDFMERGRAMLRRHTTRVHDLIAERERAATPRAG
jgi:DNA-binding MarR family transcriptional regulator